MAAAELNEEEFDQQYQAKVETLSESGEPVSLDDPAYLVDERYTSGVTTPFKIEVKEGRNTFDFKLTSKPSPDN